MNPKVPSPAVQDCAGHSGLISDPPHSQEKVSMDSFQRRKPRVSEFSALGQGLQM